MDNKKHAQAGMKDLTWTMVIQRFTVVNYGRNFVRCCWHYMFRALRDVATAINYGRKYLIALALGRSTQRY